MKQADVVVGGVYMTTISGGRSKVRVMARRENAAGRTYFEVERPEAPGRKPMRRTAAALRPGPTCRLRPGLTDAQLEALTEYPDYTTRDLARLEIARRAANACAGAGVGCECGRDHGDGGDRVVPHLAEG
jgi:hypothetical protein